MKSTIVIPLDGTPLSEAAVPHARGMSARGDAELKLIWVRESYPESLDFEWPPEQQASMERLAEKLGLPLHVATGNPAGEIVRYAESVQADLIVMGTHGRRGLQRLLLGSVADKVMRHSPCPVLLVREGAESTRYRRILVPLDGTPTSERSLGAACWLARHDESELTLVRVLDFPNPTFASSEIPSTWADSARVDMDTANRSYIEERAEDLRRRGFKVDSHYRHGNAAERIVEHEQDLTVLMSQSHGGFFGSVASQVVHRAKNPVLVLRGGGSFMRLEVPETVAS